MYNEKLSMSIKTYNRDKLLNEYIDYIIETMVLFHIDLYVLDGSDNDKTQCCVESYVKKYSNIMYIRYDDADGGLKRLWDCWKLPNTEYVWLMGDNFRVSIDALRKIIKILSADDYIDVLTFYDMYVKEKESQYYNIPQMFLRDLAVPLTHFGSTIIKKNLLQECRLKEYWDRFAPYDSPFPHIYIYSYAICKENFKGYFLYMESGMRVTLNEKAVSGCFKKHLVWHFFLKNWNELIDILPIDYNSVREDLYRKIDQETDFFAMHNLENMRMYGEYDLKTVLKQRKYIKRSLSTSYIKIFKVAITPVWIVMRKQKKRQQFLKKYLKSGNRKKVIMYGAGKHGMDIYDELIEAEKRGIIEIVAVVDKNYHTIFSDKFTVESVENVRDRDCDKILVSIISFEIFEEVRSELIKNGVKKSKIVHV